MKPETAIAKQLDREHSEMLSRHVLAVIPEHTDIDPKHIDVIWKLACRNTQVMTAKETGYHPIHVNRLAQRYRSAINTLSSRIAELCQAFADAYGMQAVEMGFATLAQLRARSEPIEPKDLRDIMQSAKDAQEIAHKLADNTPDPHATRRKARDISAAVAQLESIKQADDPGAVSQ